MLRPSVKVSVIWLAPSELTEVMDSSPWICPNCRSSGAVIRLEITSGEAPGICVVIWMVGKSTCGRAETGNTRYPSAPASSTASASSVVAIGRAMNGAEMFMLVSCPRRSPAFGRPSRISRPLIPKQ